MTDQERIADLEARLAAIEGRFAREDAAALAQTEADAQDRRKRTLRWIDTATLKTNSQLAIGVYADDIQSCSDAITDERRALLAAYVENDIAELERSIAKNGPVLYTERTLELARERLDALTRLGAKREKIRLLTEVS